MVASPIQVYPSDNLGSILVRIQAQLQMRRRNTRCGRRFVGQGDPLGIHLCTLAANQTFPAFQPAAPILRLVYGTNARMPRSPLSVNSTIVLDFGFERV
jgi:hypothetical protein